MLKETKWHQQLSFSCFKTLQSLFEYLLFYVVFFFFFPLPTRAFVNALSVLLTKEKQTQFKPSCERFSCSFRPLLRAYIYAAGQLETAAFI